jgi:hypothetical protein
MNNYYKPGQEVPSSGIYEVYHQGHSLDHQVTCVKGEPFPPCHGCGHGVQFSLAVAAHHVRNHENFRSR